MLLLRGVIHPRWLRRCTPRLLGVALLRLRRRGDPAPCQRGASRPSRRTLFPTGS